jgi:hypothetical protein
MARAEAQFQQPAITTSLRAALSILKHGVVFRQSARHKRERVPGTGPMLRVKASPQATVAIELDSMFYVYLLHSKDNGSYIGYSTDLKRLLSEQKGGASFATKSRGPWELIYYEA